MTDTALQPFAETDATVEPAEAEVSPTPPAPVAAEPVTPATASGRVVTASAPMVSDSSSFVYALGRIEPRFPSLSVEKEVAQVVARMDTAGYNDRQTMRAVLTDRENRYLVRNLCWVFLIEGLETYLLVPRDPADFDLLIDSYREDAGADDLDVVIGVRGPVASPDMCNGLAVPIVAFDQIYSFDRDSLIQSIPRPEGVPKARDAAFRTTARDLLSQIRPAGRQRRRHRRAPGPQLPDAPVAQPLWQRGRAFDRSWSFTGVEVRPSQLSGVRNVVDVIWSSVTSRRATSWRRSSPASTSPRSSRSWSASSRPTTRGEDEQVADHEDRTNDRAGAPPRRVRLPGFVSDEPVGLGDAIKRATTAVGIKPCGGCAQRAATLNRWVEFTGRRK